MFTRPPMAMVVHALERPCAHFWICTPSNTNNILCMALAASAVVLDISAGCQSVMTQGRLQVLWEGDFLTWSPRATRSSAEPVDPVTVPAATAMSQTGLEDSMPSVELLMPWIHEHPKSRKRPPVAGTVYIRPPVRLRPSNTMTLMPCTGLVWKQASHVLWFPVHC